MLNITLFNSKHVPNYNNVIFVFTIFFAEEETNIRIKNET